MLVALDAHSDHIMLPRHTWEIPPRVEWSVVATTTLQFSNRRSKRSKTIIGLVEAYYA